MAGYKIEIDREACISDGICVDCAGSTFELDDEEIAVVIAEDGDSPEEILEAAESCPTDAITLYDKDTGKKVHPEE